VLDAFRGAIKVQVKDPLSVCADPEIIFTHPPGAASLRGDGVSLAHIATRPPATGIIVPFFEQLRNAKHLASPCKTIRTARFLLQERRRWKHYFYLFLDKTDGLHALVIPVDSTQKFVCTTNLFYYKEGGER